MVEIPDLIQKVKPRRRLTSSSASVGSIRASFTAETQKVKPRRRLSSSSAGVGSMSASFTAETTHKVKPRRRLTSSSAGVGSMRVLFTADSVTPAEGASLKSETSLVNDAVVENAAKCLEDIDKTDDVNIELAKPSRDLRQQGRGPRRGRRDRGNRNDSQSEGVGSMRSSLEDRGNRNISQSEGVDTMRFSLQMDAVNKEDLERRITLSELSQMSTRVRATYKNDHCFY